MINWRRRAYVVSRFSPRTAAGMDSGQIVFALISSTRTRMLMGTCPE